MWDNMADYSKFHPLPRMALAVCKQCLCFLAGKKLVRREVKGLFKIRNLGN